jgi:probable F420-dependent oxidoreductase
MPAIPSTPIPDPLIWLAYVASATTRIRLATGILILPERNPVVLAKELATLDSLSGGRVEIGIGVGWLREEFEAAGVSWPHRGRRTDEYIDLLRTLWTEDPSAFKGEFYNLESCRMHPKPVQTPHPPIHVGGETTPALRRAAAKGQGWYSFNRLPQDMAAPLSELDGLLAEHGRSRADVTVTVCSYMHALTPELVEGYAEAGVDQVLGLMFALDTGGVEAALAGLDPARERAASL